ncbi:hypothetical protein [Natrinema longum]|uniref:Uncharacterized protein n=1 Tax=Natrinema longum TaxID=370324 RepID=A0A8A2U3P0_9EURY|nr:hypothetical protein [Natrinema longum]MBZ6494993.1 hypothetical protein [Natrinema longum]QSW83711.1 hypothetical protein J0X27_09465 [Natrinema longum]
MSAEYGAHISYEIGVEVSSSEGVFLPFNGSRTRRTGLMQGIPAHRG